MGPACTLWSKVARPHDQWWSDTIITNTPCCCFLSAYWIHILPRAVQTSTSLTLTSSVPPILISQTGKLRHWAAQHFHAATQ